MPISPITQKETQLERSPFYGIEVSRWNHKADGFADFRHDEQCGMAFFATQFRHYYGSDAKFDFQESRLALNLIRSYLWRERFTAGPPLLVTGSETKEALIDRAYANYPNRPVMIRSFADFVREAHSLTFTYKAHQTLDNIYSLFMLDVDAGQNYHADIALKKAMKSSYSHPPERPETGITFGCDDKTAPLIYQYLIEEKYLALEANATLTPKGFDLVDTMRRQGDPVSNKVFLVRRWDKDLDDMLNQACDIVEKESRILIEPVWKHEHNEKIDERVFRSIREARAIVVDLTPDTKDKGDRFNVGLEAGYAMALGKPVIAIRREPDPTDTGWRTNISFDIVTLACYPYGREATPDAVRDLADKLKARVGLAIGQWSDRPAN